MKLTTKDYVEARASLARSGFMSIQTLLNENKTVTEVATTFGIEEKVVELVKTTGSFEQFTQIVDLELEKEQLEQQVETIRTEKATPHKPAKGYYIAASVILLAIAVAIIWGIVAFIGWLASL